MVTKITTPPTQNEVIDKINELVDGKQDTLVSGTNIKTVGGNSLVGSGNVAFPTVDQTYSATSTNAQSGVAVANAIAPKQDALVSGTNIKTINGNSLLGSGNITIETSSTPNVDGETISYNSSDALQAIAVKNVRDSSTLPIWHGTEYQWNHGDPTTWYYWQTSVTALWTSGGSLPSAINWYSLAYGEGRIVACAEKSTVTAYSTDGGVTWQQGGNLPSANYNWDIITYGEDRFIVYGGSNIAVQYSTDGGVTWQRGGKLPSGDYSKIIYGNGIFIALSYSSSKSYYSSDGGINWRDTTIPQATYPNGIYADNRFVLLQGGDTTANSIYSTDGGVTWQQGGNLPSAGFWFGLAFGDNKFVAVKGLGSNQSAYSTDGGVTWQRGGNLPSNSYWSSVVYGNGIFLAIYSSGSAYSTDGGVTWHSSTILSGSGWRPPVYNNSNFATVRNGSTDSAIFSVTYDKCYTDTASPTTTSVVYSEPAVASSYTISSVTSGAITLSNNNTYYYNQSGNQQTYQTIGDAHPEYLCFIDGVGVKIGNTMIATNNSNS